MRPARILLVYLVAVSLIGALLAPWLYWFAESMARHAAVFRYIADHSFPKFVNRAMLLTAFAGIWPLLRALDLRGWQKVGLPKPAGNWRRVWKGFGLAFGTMAFIGGISVASGGRVIDDTWGILRKIPGIAWNAAIVAVTEEILFRGVFFGALRRTMAWPAALALTSFIYASLHFFSKVEAPPDITWASGLVVLGRMGSRLLDPTVVVPGFFTLMAAGSIFGLAYQRTGNLYFSIGLHAGWVFWPKTYNVVTNPVRDFLPWLFGSSKLYDGWLTCGVLAGIFAVALAWRPAEPRGIESHAS